MSVLDIQHGGNHYKQGIQPIEYIQLNGLTYFEGNVIKYVTRHKQKNGLEDLKKAMHYLQMIMEFEYNQESEVSFSKSDEVVNSEEVHPLSPEEVDEYLKKVGLDAYANQMEAYRNNSVITTPAKSNIIDLTNYGKDPSR